MCEVIKVGSLLVIIIIVLMEGLEIDSRICNKYESLVFFVFYEYLGFKSDREFFFFRI